MHLMWHSLTFFYQQMGVDEVAHLVPNDLIRYDIKAEGDRIRIIERCKQSVRNNNPTKSGMLCHYIEV